MANSSTTNRNKIDLTSKLLNILDVIGLALFVILALNIIVEIFVTAIAVFTIEDYLDQLMGFGQISIIGIILVIVIPAPVSFGYEWIGSRLFKWDEDKKLIHFGISYIILVSILFVILVLLLYIVCIPSYPLLQDPYLMGKETFLGIIFFLWWFFGFIISSIGLALLTLWVFLVKYSK